MKACDRAGNCTATEEFSIPNKSGSKKGYCRQIYGIKKPASNVCGDKDVNCYLVEDKK